MKTLTGFTLAELLISLAILGVIATFVIPKIISAQQDARRMTIFKESIVMVSNLIYSGNIQGTITESSFSNATNYVNAVKICPTDSVAEGCWAGTADVYSQDVGFILHNGASVVGFDNNSNGSHDDYVYVDWNGPNAGSNTFGDDQIQLEFFFSGAAYKPGYFRAIPGQTASQTLFSQIFQ